MQQLVRCPFRAVPKIGRKLFRVGLAWCTYTSIVCTYTANLAGQTGENTMNATKATDMNATTTNTAVIYDVDDECTWGYSYLAHFSTEVVAATGDQPMTVAGRWWFAEDAVEQYAMDVVEVDGIDWGVHIERKGGEIEWVSYWTGGESVPVVMHKRWDMKHIDGYTYWAIPEAWRPVSASDFEDD